ncbi:hypothetical protein EJ03DRAFT_330122 [Teratosphaeria nubilosa]|uniref:Uncharacterized protein n=1 Tax=Teratosphaeria nubilosa TaxID=161662 RepID=A0A6G1L0Q2_9PEZI|nr:hypothetical protein EJ03DRAFT_330122 [Teratosphaeria nubilosa]
MRDLIQSSTRNLPRTGRIETGTCPIGRTDLLWAAVSEEVMLRFEKAVEMLKMGWELVMMGRCLRERFRRGW